MLLIPTVTLMPVKSMARVEQVVAVQKYRRQLESDCQRVRARRCR